MREIKQWRAFLLGLISNCHTPEGWFWAEGEEGGGGGEFKNNLRGIRQWRVFLLGLISIAILLKVGFGQRGREGEEEEEEEEEEEGEFKNNLRGIRQWRVFLLGLISIVILLKVGFGERGRRVGGRREGTPKREYKGVLLLLIILL